MVEIIILRNLLIALALGALIGLEREYARYRKKGHDYAGIRTFPLIALFGALSAYFSDIFNPWILVVGIILIGILIVISYFLVNEKTRQYHGATSEVAGFLTFFIGVITYINELRLAVALTIIITIILYARSILHHFAERITKHELSGTLKFAVIAFIILPFLPNQSYGPYEFFNPFMIWLMVVFVCGISFVGYILMKWFGEKGIELAGILGGIVSSTAVTSSFAERSKRETKIFKALALGVILANGVMFFRILVEVLVLNSALFLKLIPPMLILAAATVVFAYFLWRNIQKVKEASGKIKGKIQLSSPFSLGPALKFGAFFAVILALAKLGYIFFSTKGIYLASFLSGFADVDAITVTLSQLALDNIEVEVARNGIIIAVLTNIAVKGGIAYLFGSRKFGWTILAFFLFLALLGAGMIFLL